MIQSTDQMGNPISLSSPPKRIISLVPSQTELLYDLGLEEEVVGITRYCVHPKKWWKNKTRIGGTKQLKMDQIAALQPDLIIGNKEENQQEQIEALQRAYPVWMSDIETISDSLEMIEKIGEIVDRPSEARQLIQQIQQGLAAISAQRPISVAYFIWYNPMMVAASNTFIHEMLKACGLQNVFEDQERYPSVNMEQLQATAPEIVFLSSEPFPFKNRHLAEFQSALPNSKILLVDGEAFSWYGSRIAKSIPYLQQLIESISG